VFGTLHHYIVFNHPCRRLQLSNILSDLTIYVLLDELIKLTIFQSLFKVIESSDEFVQL
jgi:hypothetical protein